MQLPVNIKINLCLLCLFVSGLICGLFLQKSLCIFVAYFFFFEYSFPMVVKRSITKEDYNSSVHDFFTK